MSIWRNLPLRAKIGVFLFGFFALVAIFGPIFEPFNPGFENQDPKFSLNPPSLHHLLGTTQLGRQRSSRSGPSTLEWGSRKRERLWRGKGRYELPVPVGRR